jgi:sulfate transport system substrate-binding protein
VVTFNQVTDVQILHDQGDLIAADWQSRLPNNSVPYYSLPAFLVRKGNPKNIKDWSDLVRDDVKVVFPNPKTSGNGRYTYLAYAYGDVLVTFEAEVQSIGSQYGKDRTDLVIPSVSLRADFPVSVVDKVVDERGSRKSPRPISNISTRRMRRRSSPPSTARSTRTWLRSTPRISRMCAC